MQGFLRTRYTPLVHSSEPDCREPNVEQQPRPEIQPITDPFTAKVEVDSEPSLIVEPDVLNKPELEVDAELVSLQEDTPSRPTEVEDLLI